MLTLAYAQCGLPGTPVCGSVKKKIEKKTAAPSVKVRKPKQTSTNNEIEEPGSIFKQIRLGRTLIVLYEQDETNLLFTMEALNDFTLGDEALIYVDLNKNNRVDCSDIMYAVWAGNNKISASFFQNTMTDCDMGLKLNSTATVLSRFISTGNQKREHPVWNFKIPKDEIGSNDGIVHLRFEYWDRSKNYTDCPHADCVVKIPDYIWQGSSSLNFGPVKRIKYLL